MAAIKQKMSKQVKTRKVACIVMGYLWKTKMVKVGVCILSALGELMTNCAELDCDDD